MTDQATRRCGPGIRTRVWRNGKLEEEDFAFEEISDHLRNPDCLIWVDLAEPDHARLLALAEELSLDPNSVEDAIGSDERAKAVSYGSYLFVSAYSTSLDSEFHLRDDRVSAYVLDRALVTVHGPHWQGMGEAVRRWDEAEAETLSETGVDALLYGLLDVVVDGQFDTVQALDAAIESFEDGLFGEHPQTRHEQKQVYDVRRASVDFRRLVVPMTQVVGTLHRVRGAKHRALESSWNDLADHVARVIEWTDSLRDQLNNLFVSNMALQDTRMNNVMKQLTAWAAIIAVPTAVTGFYGQNVPYPGFAQHWGFATSSAILVISMVTLYVSFKRRGWL